MYRGIVYSEQPAGKIKNEQIDELIGRGGETFSWRGSARRDPMNGDARVQGVDKFAGLGNNFHSSSGKLLAVFRRLGAREHLRYLAELKLKAVDSIHIHNKTMQYNWRGALSVLAHF
jgi:hypothetical protein